MGKKFKVIIPDDTDFAAMIQLAFDLSVNPSMARGEEKNVNTYLTHREASAIHQSKAGTGSFIDFYKTRLQYLWVDYVKDKRVKLNVTHHLKNDEYYFDSYWIGHSEQKTRKLFEFLGYSKEASANAAGFFEKKRPNNDEIF
jgi:hypothetical protein